jgi:hypothetical protein
MMYITTRRRPSVVLAAGATLAVAIALALLVADPARAAGVDVGTNAGNMLKGWAEALVFPVAALGGLGAYLKRDIGMAFSLLTITVIVGAFAYAPSGVQDVITALWSTLIR